VIFLAAILGTMAYLHWWLRRARRAVRKLVRDGDAEWVALCRVVQGGQHVEGARTAPSYLPPTGVVAISGDVFSWRPDAYSKKKGYHDATLKVHDFECLSVRRRRDITGVMLREVHLRLSGNDIIFSFYAEEGQTPSLLAGPINS
jgi:hypothetical protein